MTRWIHISDLQFGCGEAEQNDNDACARELVERVIQEKPNFVINSGDLIHGGPDQDAQDVMEYWEDYRRAVKPLEELCPVISVPGNHDQTRPDLSTELYCRQSGRSGQPPYYSVTIQGVHTICLDVVPFPHRGGFLSSSEQGKWLRRELGQPRQSRCLIVAGHYPIFLSPAIYNNADSSLRYDESTGEKGDLLPLLLEAQVDLYLCGHLHLYERTGYSRLIQVMAGAFGLAFPDLMQQKPNRYSKVLDERQCYVRFSLTESAILGEAVSLDGEVIDSWSQIPASN